MTGIACRAPTPSEEWVRCKPWLMAALEHDGGFNTIEDVETRIAAGDAHFWPGKRAAGVTEFMAFPRCKALNFWLVGGDLDELLDHMMPAAEAWARTQGCTKTVAFGRRGWKPKLAERGFSEGWTVFVKELA